MLRFKSSKFDDHGGEIVARVARERRVHEQMRQRLGVELGVLGLEQCIDRLLIAQHVPDLASVVLGAMRDDTHDNENARRRRRR